MKHHQKEFIKIFSGTCKQSNNKLEFLDEFIFSIKNSNNICIYILFLIFSFIFIRPKWNVCLILNITIAYKIKFRNLVLKYQEKFHRAQYIFVDIFWIFLVLGINILRTQQNIRIKKKLIKYLWQSFNLVFISLKILFLQSLQKVI